VPSQWTTFPCTPVRARWRYWEDGRIEVDGMGFPIAAKSAGSRDPWSPKVALWKEPIASFGAQYGVPEHWIAAIMAFESGGQAAAKSPAGAIGLMQITPATGRAWANMIHRPLSSTDELADPLLNIELGVAGLASLLKGVKGDFVAAAAGYNAGTDKFGQPHCLKPLDTRPGYWGVLTDGSAYPLQVIRFANRALLEGFPAAPKPPDLLTPPASKPVPSPLTVAAATAAGAFAAYLLTRRLAGRSLGRWLRQARA
jgi:soluble lytic murein transglycosylase-like protein